MIHRKASRKTWTLGTSRRISSITREPTSCKALSVFLRWKSIPFKLRTHRSSKLRSRLSSFNDKLSGTDDSDKRATRKSMGIPDISQVIMGTYASGTPYCAFKGLETKQRRMGLTETSVAPSSSFNIDSNVSKKSSRDTCLGTTQSVSISDPGACTPSRYDPNVKILPPAALAAASERPRSIEILFTNLFTRAATRPRTISLR